MADNRKAEAIEIMARFCVAGMVTPSNYHVLLAEFDALGIVFTPTLERAIGERVKAISEPPTTEEVEAAYEYLDALGDAE